ncbi:MAG TPA: hypothetical protein H9825_01050 [Candidatus Sphingobacterium stercorigallinarum]|nr:hypothetical protein [Candidatus Sphingobacterium stercorigallinarum]
MERISKLLLIVVTVAIVSSCGVFRNKSKNKDVQKVEASVRVEKKVEESTGSTVTVKETEIDKGTVVTERKTTTKTTSGGKSKVEIKKGDLKDGENFLRDTAGNMVRAVLDTLDKTLTIEFNLPVTTTETTTNERITESKNNHREREEESRDTTRKEVAVTVDSIRRETSEQSTSESSPNTWALFVNKIGWAVGLVVVIGFLLWWLRRRRQM